MVPLKKHFDVLDQHLARLLLEAEDKARDVCLIIAACAVRVLCRLSFLRSSRVVCRLRCRPRLHYRLLTLRPGAY